MRSRKLLLVTYHFPPSNAAAVYRMLGLVRHLPRYGWEPVVVAPPQMPDEPQDSELLHQVPESTKVISVPFPQGRFARQLRRWVPEGIWLPRAWQACQRAMRDHRPDAILTSGPPHCVHWLGLHFKKRRRLPWVACFRDPWVVNHLHKEQAPGWAVRGERQIMEHADIVVANTPLNQAGWQAAYPGAAGKIVTITNGFEPDRFRSLTAPVRQDRLVLLHIGELYAGRDPRPLLDALNELEKEGRRPRFIVHFVGRFSGEFDLPQEVRQRGLEHTVLLSEQVPNGGALTRMVEADVLLLLQTPGVPLGVPCKLYDYLGARRPILALAEEVGDIAWVLQSSGVPHRLAPASDATRIKQALLELAEIARQPRDDALAKPKLQRFTREQMAADLAHELDGCLVKRRGPQGLGRPRPPRCLTGSDC